MYIRSLKLNNFINYKELDIEFSRGTNILYGDNAQGKTNILESIYYGSTSKSHKGNKDREVIRFNEFESHINLMVVKNDAPVRIDIHLKKNKPKGIAINGIPVKKATELFGILSVVLFSPEDLNIIKNGPAERRRFIDMELCQIDKIYLSNLSNYTKILNQRNSLLKEINVNNDNALKETLDIWDMQLSDYGAKIIARRNTFIDEINEIIYGIHRSLTNGKEELIIKYEPNIMHNNLYDEIVRNRNRDIYLKMTTVGPHRDDICIMNKDIDLRTYGSQGQQRTAALSLKLSEIELIKRLTNDVPVLLLDDVLSELDSNRQKFLLNSITNVQTVITCTGLDEFIENRFNIDNIYRVVEGTVERSNNE